MVCNYFSRHIWVSVTPGLPVQINPLSNRQYWGSIFTSLVYQRLVLKLPILDLNNATLAAHILLAAFHWSPVFFFSIWYPEKQESEPNRKKVMSAMTKSLKCTQDSLCFWGLGVCYSLLHFLWFCFVCLFVVVFMGLFFRDETKNYTSVPIKKHGPAFAKRLWFFFFHAERILTDGTISKWKLYKKFVYAINKKYMYHAKFVHGWWTWFDVKILTTILF